MTEDKDEQPQEVVELTPEQLYQALALDIGNQLLGLAASFAPNFPQERLGEVVDGMVREQLTIAEKIMPSLTNPELYRSGKFLIEINSRGAGPDVEPFIMQCQKRPEDCKTPFDALGQALLLSFLLMPAVRALLRMYGWDYLFKEPKGDGTDNNMGGGLVLLKG